MKVTSGLSVMKLLHARILPETAKFIDNYLCRRIGVPEANEVSFWGFRRAAEWRLICLKKT